MSEQQLLTYKDHPVLRKGDLVYYGSFENKHIVVLKVLDSTPLKDISVSKNIAVELQLNDPDISESGRIQKTSTRDGMYEALDLANIWLTRALGGK